MLPRGSKIDEIVPGTPTCVKCGRGALIMYKGEMMCGRCQLNTMRLDKKRESIDLMKVAIKELREEE